MSKQFERRIEIFTGESGSESGLGISDLRIVFNVKKTSKKTTNKATVKIYNLNNQSLSKIKKGNILIIKAGYVSTNPEDKIVFAGKIMSSAMKQNNELQIDCSDGEQINLKKIALSYNSGTSCRRILNDIISQIPLANQRSVQVPNFEDVEFNNGFSFAGKIPDLIDKITDTIGLEWSVQNNEFKLVKPDGDDGTRAVFLSAETGLIGYPEKMDDTEYDSTGWKIQCLLQPLIEPNGIVQINSSRIENTTNFKVVSVEHTADNFSDKFVTNAEVIEYE